MVVTCVVVFLYVESLVAWFSVKVEGATTTVGVGEKVPVVGVSITITGTLLTGPTVVAVPAVDEPIVEVGTGAATAELVVVLLLFTGLSSVAHP